MENENAETKVEEVTEESNFDTLSELDKTCGRIYRR